MEKRRIKCRSEWSRSDCLIASFLTELTNGSNSLLGHELLTNFLIKCQKNVTSRPLYGSGYGVSVPQYVWKTAWPRQYWYIRKIQSSWLLKLCLLLDHKNRLLLFAIFWQGYLLLLWVLCIWVRMVCRRAGVGGGKDRHLVPRPDNEDQGWVLFKSLES